ncbi:MAG: hypothetical protein HY047_04745 [Acidobacteria bacterium]|nr:hypothetical protein [Acidobacteriota bacterium]
MTDRIDEYLEGHLDQAQLASAEREEADVVEGAIAEMRAFVNARPAPDLTAAVMRQIEPLRAPHPRPRGTLARWADSVWATRHVSLRLRPAYGLLAAAAVVALVVFARAEWRSSVDRAASRIASTSTAAPPQLFVQFRLQAPDAARVRLAGSFTNWQPRYELHQTAPGLWTIFIPLSPGVHDYAFLVDGERWMPDPSAPAVDDGFGGADSRLALSPPEASL